MYRRLFDAFDSRNHLVRKFQLIPILADLAKHAAKEKVTRVTIATLRNLLTIAPEQNVPAMIAANLLNLVNSLSTRKWSDDDLIEDLKYLKDELWERQQGLT